MRSSKLARDSTLAPLAVGLLSFALGCTEEGEFRPRALPDAQPFREAGALSLDSGGVTSAAPTATEVTETWSPLRQPWRTGAGRWASWLTDQCPHHLTSLDLDTTVPPMLWQRCAGDTEGCSELEVTWDYATLPFREARVSEADGNLSLSLYVISRRSDTYGDLVYWTFSANPDGAPLGMWGSFRGEGTEDVRGCSPNSAVQTTARHHCIGMARSLAGKETPAIWVLLDPADPREKVLQTLPAHGIGIFRCSEQLTLAVDTGGRLWSYDIDEGVERQVQFQAGVAHIAKPFDDKVFVTRGGATEAGEYLDGWVWTHQDGPKALIQPTSGFVFDLETDGTYLVWTLSHGPGALERGTAEVWVSPLSLEPTDLEPRKLGEVPNTRASNSYGMVRNGYFVGIEGNLSDPTLPTELHVFRLSDGTHWTVPKPDGTRLGAPLHINDEEIWYEGEREGVSMTIIRQRMTNLVLVQ